MITQISKKIAIALGAASVAVVSNNLAAQAGPALQSLNNLTNTAEFSINNTYGQSFSVDGVITSAITPFAAGGAGGSAILDFTAQTATLTTGFTGALGDSTSAAAQFKAVETVEAKVATPLLTPPLTLSATLAAVSLAGSASPQTVGASISSTVFGPSTVKATSSYTNQLIHDLSAF